MIRYLGQEIGLKPFLVLFFTVKANIFFFLFFFFRVKNATLAIRIGPLNSLRAC